MAETTCDRCGHGEPNVHDLTDLERQFATHFLAETYNGEGDERRRSYAPEPVGLMLRNDPHYFLCQDAIHRARRLLAAFPGLSTPPLVGQGGSEGLAELIGEVLDRHVGWQMHRGQMVDELSAAIVAHLQTPGSGA